MEKNTMDLDWKKFEKAMLEGYIKGLDEFQNKKEMFRLHRRNSLVSKK